MMIDVLVLVSDHLAELVLRVVELLLLLRKLRLQTVDLVNELLLQGLVLPRHVSRHGKRRLPVLLAVIFHLVDLSTQLELASFRLLCLRRLRMQVALKRLNLLAQIGPSLLCVGDTRRHQSAALCYYPSSPSLSNVSTPRCFEQVQPVGAAE